MDRPSFESQLTSTNALLGKYKLKINKKLNKDEVAFLEAAQNGHLQTLVEVASRTNFFKKSNVDVNCADSLGRTALMIASIAGKFSIVEYLVTVLKVDTEIQDAVR
jgi:ankyrin repeat protein